MKFVRQIVGPKAFGDSQPSELEREQVWNELREMILPRLEQHLNDKQRRFFCSEEDVTIIDLQYYFELEQIISIDSSKKIS